MSTKHKKTKLRDNPAPEKPVFRWLHPCNESMTFEAPQSMIDDANRMADALGIDAGQVATFGVLLYLEALLTTGVDARMRQLDRDFGQQGFSEEFKRHLDATPGRAKLLREVREEIANFRAYAKARGRYLQYETLRVTRSN